MMGNDFEYLLNYDLTVQTLGKTDYNSPLNLSEKYGDSIVNFVPDNERILSINTEEQLDYCIKNNIKIPSFEKAGPRSKLFFKPGETISAIVTCGGLCPGLNDVIRSLVIMNYYRYGNKVTYGFKYGYEGFIDEYHHEILNLTPRTVLDINKIGGTILGSSRGPQDVGKIVDKLVELNVSVLYTIGGDGTLRGALDISNEIKKRNLKIAIIGIPKTIDNDISFINKSFGTETAFSKACDSIFSAHTEARGSYNGVGLVKVMGRHSGFIAAKATLATNDVNFFLIPEIPFKLHGENGFLNALKKRLNHNKHAVILVAEGAGQDLVESTESSFDASGNKKLFDIGLFLQNEIKTYFKKENIPITIKYIDPSYIIRSTSTTANDSIFCFQLAQRAVHAGMSGKTGIVVGYYRNEFIHIPISVAVSKRQTIDPESELWLSVLETTGQPIKFTE